MIWGSWEKFMVHYVLDPWMMKLSILYQELWIIQDYAYYLLVLCMVYVKSIGK